MERDGFWLKAALGSFVNGNSDFGRRNQQTDSRNGAIG
jgi:hypothetical protein